MRRQENDRGRVGRWNRDCFGLEGLIVEPQLDFGFLLFGRIVRHAGKDSPLIGVLRVWPHVERHDAQIVRAPANQVINQRQTLVLDLAQAGRRAVAEQVHFRAGLVAGEGFGHFQCFDQARGRVGHLARLEGAAQQRFLAGLGLLDLSDRGREQHHHAVGVAQAVDQIAAVHFRHRVRAAGEQNEARRATFGLGEVVEERLFP